MTRAHKKSLEKFSVVLETTVRHTRTVVVRAADKAAAEAQALAKYTPSPSNLSGWEALQGRGETFVYDCQQADRSETVTEER